MANAPTHNIYVNIGGDDSKMTMKVGAAWAHQNGEGFNIVLNANPIDGKMVAFPVKDEQAKEDLPKAK